MIQSYEKEFSENVVFMVWGTSVFAVVFQSKTEISRFLPWKKGFLNSGKIN